MAMRPVSAWPVSTRAIQARVLEVTEKREMDGTQKRRTADGMPGWAVSMVVQLPGQDRSLLDLTVYQQECPQLAEFSPVRFVGDELIVHQWATGGSGGFWYECQGIEPADSKVSHSKGEAA